MVDFWGSLHTSILTVVLPGDIGGDAVISELGEVRQEGVKKGVSQSRHYEK